jgi:hypothetical protein|tara:strand:- start:2335 stop:2562 length:228 start_codon:yes stop_codon:yes gene_type:complete
LASVNLELAGNSTINSIPEVLRNFSHGVDGLPWQLFRPMILQDLLQVLVNAFQQILIGKNTGSGGILSAEVSCIP